MAEEAICKAADTCTEQNIEVRCKVRLVQLYAVSDVAFANYSTLFDRAAIQWAATSF